ncbi:MAG: D-alanine--D-alanine ligase [Firmicutes bacterium]|nr:D-alanine--D-alanine ligase [Bacillota bacterium]
MNKLKLAVLTGGSSIEREVSFRSAENILKNLDTQKYDIHTIELPKDKRDTAWVMQLIALAPDFVLSALHGGRGENGAVQGLLQCLNIPYAGSGILSCALCMNKQAAKDIMSKAHIPVIDGEFIPLDADINTFEQRLEQLEYPLIVKPNRGGSSIGIEVAEDFAALKKAVENIRTAYADDAVTEKYIDGKEVTCAVVQTEDGLRIMSVLDINKAKGIYDYDAKYLSRESAVSFTTLPEYMKKMIEDIAVKAFNILHCKGYGCVDMLVKDEQIYVIEINTLPGMTDHSLIPAAAAQTGMSLGEFLDILIKQRIKK